MLKIALNRNDFPKKLFLLQCFYNSIIIGYFYDLIF